MTRRALTLLEILISTTVLAVIVLVVGQSLASGTSAQRMISARGESDDTVSRLVKQVTQDLRYADIDCIYLDTNNSPTWYASQGGTTDLYSFKICTGFDTSSATVTSLGQMSKFRTAVVLQFQRSTTDPNCGILTRTAHAITDDGTRAGNDVTTVLSSNLAWSYIDPAQPTAGAQRGFSISQIDSSSTTVVGKRLVVNAAMRPSTVTSIAVSDSGIPEITPITTASSAVYLRSTMFSGFGVLAPVITSELTRTANVGTAMRYDVVATNYPTKYTAAPLPDGLSISASSGAITGTPTTTGTVAVTITAGNSAGTDSRVLTMTVNGPIPQMTSPSSISAVRNTAFSFQITATNSPTRYYAVSLPAGLTINTTTGLISGTPTTNGTTTCQLYLLNANGVSLPTLAITVADTTLPPPVVSSLTASGSVNTAMQVQIQATNSPTSYSASGLPSGLTCNSSSGLISGTPTSVFSGRVTITATNAAGTGSGTLTLGVLNATQAPVVTSETVNAVVGTAMTYGIVATNSPTAYGASGVPTWLSSPTTTGRLSGTPPTAGTYRIGLSASNAGGTGTGTLTLVVADLPTPAITSVLTAQGSASVLFTYTITASNSPTAYSASGLPAGVSLNTATGVISGTPTTAGTYSVGLSATNAGGSGTATLVITIAAAPEPPAISLGAATISGRNWQVIGTITARAGYPVDTASFAWSASLNGVTSTAFTIKRGWIASEAGSGSKSLGSNEFTISGSTFTGALAVTASIADGDGRTGSTTRNY